jgi:hypothetical protein
MRKRFASRAVAIRLAALFLFSLSTWAQQHPPSFPRAGATKVRESDLFVIWDVTWEAGKAVELRQHQLDQVSVFLSEGAIKVTRPDGIWSIEQERFGSVRFESKGTVDTEEGVSDKPSRAMVFQLKAFTPTKWPITEGIPGQFPREGAVKLFETDRIIVWDDTWKIGVRTKTHLHYHPVTGVYLEAGATRTISEPVQGIPVPPRIHSRKLGDVVELTEPLKGPHFEEAIEGSPRVIYIEFK